MRYRSPAGLLAAVVLLAALAPMSGSGGPWAGTVGGHVAAPAAAPAEAGAPVPLQHHDRLVTIPLRDGPRIAYQAYGPSWMAYDHADRSMFVAVAPSSLEEVAVAWGYQINATIPVGSDPFAVAVDNGTGQVFVTNSGSDNVSVVNDSTLTVVGTIAVGSEPFGIAFDPATGLVFVANNGSDNVSVISPSKLAVVANIAVGAGPIGVSADPATGQVFVADGSSNQLTILSDTSLQVVATVGTGVHPVGVTVDNSSDTVFVGNGGSQNFTVVDPTTDQVVANAPVPGPFLALQGISYDWLTGEVWAGAGHSLAVELNATTLHVDGYWTTDPSDAAVDTDNGAVCLSDTGNTSLGCLYRTESWTSTPLIFHPTGLPLGASWSIAIAQGSSTFHGNVTNATGGAANLSFGVWGYPPFGEYTYWITAGPGFTVAPSAGNVTVSGSTGATVNLTFTAAGGSYPVWFNETGLPSGDHWSADLAGSTVPSNGSSILFRLGNGTGFAYRVSGPTGYAATPSSGLVNISGASLLVAITFQGSAAATYPVNFTALGLPTGSEWSVAVSGTTYPTLAGTATVRLPNGSYVATFSGPVGYRPADPSIAFQVAGAAVGIDVPFTRAAGGYPVTFQESGLPTGQTWGVTVDFGHLSTSGDNVTASLPNGTYAFGVTAVSGFAPTPANGTITVAGGPVEVTIVFASTGASLILLTFTEFGLPAGTNWSVSLSGTGGVVVAGSHSFRVTPGSYQFSVGAPPGWTAYPSNGTIDATANWTQYVTFVETGPPSNATYPVIFIAWDYGGGLAWTVTIDSTSYSTTALNQTIALANGTYGYVIQGGPGDASPGSGEFTVSGAPVTVHFSFPPCACGPPPFPNGFGAPETVNALAVGLLVLVASVVAIGAAAVAYAFWRPPRPPLPPGPAGPAPR